MLKPHPTTTTRWDPFARSRTMRRATRLMRSAPATDEPPNFITTSELGMARILAEGWCRPGSALTACHCPVAAGEPSGSIVAGARPPWPGITRGLDDIVSRRRHPASEVGSMDRTLFPGGDDPG